MQNLLPTSSVISGLSKYYRIINGNLHFQLLGNGDYKCPRLMSIKLSVSYQEYMSAISTITLPIRGVQQTLTLLPVLTSFSSTVQFLVSQAS